MKTDLNPFVDRLSELNQSGSAADKLAIIYRDLKQLLPFIDRIAIVIYESERDLLKTFITHSDSQSTLQFYQSKLAESQTLSAIAQSRLTRVINDLGVFSDNTKQHTNSINRHGYKASHTTPFYNNGEFAGLIFINAYKREVFTEQVCQQLSPYIHLIGSLVCQEIDQVNTLLSSVSTALDISHHRDPETGAHLERMSRYARLIALKLAPLYQFDDEYVEFVYRFAPLHDVGKISIPDRILLKPGKLTDEEFDEMKRHTTAGREIMDRMLSNFNLQNMKHTHMLRNIIELHHEALDGSGYPYGLKGDEIPLEARIIAVADIFDALTSERPYKSSWSNEEAFAKLRSLSGSKLDSDCVEALARALPTVQEIQNQFQDDPF